MAAGRCISLSVLLEEGLRSVLNGSRAVVNEERAYLELPTAPGKPLIDIDFSSNRAVLDWLDDDDIRERGAVHGLA